MTIEVYDSEDLKELGLARVLIYGVPKLSGKTTLCGTTAPTPCLMLNCDGAGSTNVARRFGGKFTGVDIGSPEQLEEAVTYALKECAAGKFASVVLDTLTLLVNAILVPTFRHRFRHDKDVGFATYRETAYAATRALTRLAGVNAHLFVTAHAKGGEINLEGKMKQDVPGLVSDIVMLEYDRKSKERRLVLGTSLDAGTGGRLGGEEVTLPADLKVLLEHLGLNPTAALAGEAADEAAG